MLIRILGEKNSVKRFIMTFSLSVMLLMSIFGAISFLQIVTTRHYDDMLQNIVSIEAGQRLTDELKHSAEKYAEARKWPDYVQAQTARESLNGILDRIEAVSMDRSSLLAVRSIRELLENMDAQLAKLRSWEYDGLFQLSERCDNARYLLTRIQMLEANYASAAYPRMNRYMVHLTRTAAVILFLLLLEAVLFCMGLHEQIYEPIQRLVSGVQEISKGNFQGPDIKVAKSKEFDYLAEEVNRMKRDLSSLMETREEKLNAERLLQEAQFLALQSQVNPHFLFNVLGATAATALAWSRADAPLWASARKGLISGLVDADWENGFTLRGNGAVVTWEVESRNFYVNGDLAAAFPTDEAKADNSLSWRCTIALEG